VLCVLCEFHKQECTFVQDPQPRKRKVTGDTDKLKEGGSPKKRCVLARSCRVCACHSRRFLRRKIYNPHVHPFPRANRAHTDLSIQL
jgi:hypothetical protein